MRTITLRNTTGYVPKDETQHPDFLRALGYLAQWASLTNTYEYVEICIFEEGDVSAAYHPTAEHAKTANRPAFYIMGVIDKSSGTYSFHS
jgi:hypothetical protein